MGISAGSTEELRLLADHVAHRGEPTGKAGGWRPGDGARTSPADRIDEVRPIRDDIKARIERLLAELVPANA